MNYTIDLDNRFLSVYVNGSNEKGARAKGQKILKNYSIYDAWLLIENVVPVKKGNYFIFTISSPMLMLKNTVNGLFS